MRIFLTSCLLGASLVYGSAPAAGHGSHSFTGIGPVLNGMQSNWELVYFEDFSGDTLDTESFQYEMGSGCEKQICGWGNAEIQNYSNSAVKVEDGRLIITATKKRDILPAERESNKKFWARDAASYVTTWESGRIHTKNKVQGRYGLVSFTARLPTGKGVWPALWMLPSDPKKPWPLSGEIDVVEYNSFWAPWVTPSTIHYSALPKVARHAFETYNSTDTPLSSFSEYSVLWTPDSITFIRDGMSIGTYSKAENVWPFDDNVFHLVLNIAISPSWGDLPDEDVESFHMDVDSIKWWQRRSYKQWHSRETREMGTTVPGLPQGISRDKLAYLKTTSDSG